MTIDCPSIFVIVALRRPCLRSLPYAYNLARGLRGWLRHISRLVRFRNFFNQFDFFGNTSPGRKRINTAGIGRRNAGHARFSPPTEFFRPPGAPR